MAAGYQELYMEQGATFNTQMTLTDSSGAAYNLVGYSISSQARKSYLATTPTINFIAYAYDAANGIVQLTANAAVTANVKTNKLVYDVLIQDTNQVVTRVLEGQIIVSPGVTR